MVERRTMIALTRKQATMMGLATLALGLAMLGGPGIISFPPKAHALACVIGLLIVIEACTRLYRLAVFEETTSLGLGLIAALAPWALSFSDNAPATAVHLVLGLGIALIEGIRVWFCGWLA